MNDMMLLIEPQIPALRRYARALLRDAAAADDLVQDCLERAIGRWHQRRSDGDARTWLFAILHNLAVSRLRQKTRRGPHLPLEDAEAALPVRPATQEDALRHRDLLRGLGALPEDQRSVLLLVAVEELSYAETAAVLEVPTGTVMSRLSRARHKLMQLMDSPGSAETENTAGRTHLRRIK
ncbi:MAG: sigma-70 family RNA polymerase sigma factor [Rhodospirillaceae bacterium]|nr:MAG: sigma-70 family RNA polymerase sigma factor [Rhodospirillaceae bacterium]